MSDSSSLMLQIGDRKMELELPPEVLQEQTLLSDHEKMLAMRIAWNSYADAGLTPTEVDLMLAYANKAVEVRLELFRQKSQQYAALFVKILKEIATPSALQYILTLVDDLLRTDERVCGAFFALRALAPELPLGHLIRRVHSHDSNDLYTIYKFFRVLSVFLIHDPNPHPSEVLYMTQRLIQQLQMASATEVNVGVLCLMQLLRRDAYRVVFAREHGLEALVARLGTPGVSSQAVYQLIYCIWLATFNTQVAGSLDECRDLIPRLVDALKTSPKEKVQRIALATLRNLVDKGHNNEEMIEAGAIRVINGLAGKRWGDDDIVENIEVLREALQKNLVVMSSFDVYKKEVASGHLQWSPVHKSERFWRENALRFEEQDLAVLRMLLELLKSANPLNLAIACHDVGEFVRFHPRGKQLISDLGAKVALMALMSSTHPEVQKEALLATQKLLVANYTFLSTPDPKQKAKGKDA